MGRLKRRLMGATATVVIGVFGWLPGVAIAIPIGACYETLTESRSDVDPVTGELVLQYTAGIGGFGGYEFRGNCYVPSTTIVVDTWIGHEARAQALDPDFHIASILDAQENVFAHI